QRDIYGQADLQQDDMDPDARQFKPTEAEVATRPRRAVDAGARMPNLEKSNCGYNMVDDDETIVLDCQVKVYARDLGDGQVVFCPVCETTIDKSAGHQASAVTIERESGQIVIYCFNCSVLNVDIQCGYQKINWQGREDISLNGDYRLDLLNAHMGTGKTHAVREHLDTEKYDLVIIDECVFVQYHFLGGTITTTLPDILRTFQKILRESPKVIALQHRIPETTIAFYMDCMSLPAGSAAIIRRRVSSPVVLHPMQVRT
ncbi:hypothetical protein V1515DRAFT_519316, partial [Lipomyces mesembrius]